MTNLWSNPNLDGFKAVTAHFIECDADGNAVEASCMITFCFVEGSCTGKHLASIFFDILKENDILHMFTFAFPFLSLSFHLSLHRLVKLQRTTL